MSACDLAAVSQQVNEAIASHDDAVGSTALDAYQQACPGHGDWLRVRLAVDRGACDDARAAAARAAGEPDEARDADELARCGGSSRAGATLAKPFTGSGYALATYRTDLGFARSGHGLALAAGGAYVIADSPSGTTTIGGGVFVVQPLGDGADGRLANLWGVEERMRGGLDIHKIGSVGLESSSQIGDGRWQLSTGQVRHGLSWDVSAGGYAALWIAPNLRLTVNADARLGVLIDHTLSNGGSFGSRFHATAEVEAGAGLTALWGQ